MIVVIGGGLAGLSAALHLAEKGVAVTVCEAHPRFIGGRTRARDSYQFDWAGAAHRHSLDHGQHCMWFQYYNMRHLLSRLGLWDGAARECTSTRYIVDEGERIVRLPPFDVRPWNVASTRLHLLRNLLRATVAERPGPRDLGRLARALPAAPAARHLSPRPGLPALGQPHEIGQMFAWVGLPGGLDRVFKSLCKASTFHAHSGISAAWGLSMVESTLLHHPANHKMWCFRGNLGTHLIDPLVAALERRGGVVVRNAKAVGFDVAGGPSPSVHVAPTVAGGPARAGAISAPTVLPCDAVVSATDIPGFPALMLPSFGDRAEIRATANLETVCNATIRIVTAKRVRAGEPWMGILSGRFHCSIVTSCCRATRTSSWRGPGAGRAEVIECHAIFAHASWPRLAGGGPPG